MTKAVVFPGQGSQSVGMGKSLYETFPAAKEVFQEVDDTLQFALSRLMFEGPLDTLTLTQNAQPALLTMSMAAVRALEQAFDKSVTIFSQAAGHSLGEYSALTAIGVIKLSDAARLVRIRGTAMQDAVADGLGGMLALLGVTLTEAEAIAQASSQKDSFCVVANDNAPGQIVLSGHLSALHRAMEIGPTMGSKRGILLPVSAPFHSPLMERAAHVMQTALAEVEFGWPRLPLLANVTATYIEEPSLIKKSLVEQVTGQVRWQDIIHRMKDSGVQEIVEIGAGNVLTGLTKRIAPDLVATSLSTPHDLELFVTTLR